jgi:hypothetical protein
MVLTIKKTYAYAGFELHWVCVNGTKVLGPFTSAALARSKIQAFMAKHEGECVCVL